MVPVTVNIKNIPRRTAHPIEPFLLPFGQGVCEPGLSPQDLPCRVVKRNQHPPHPVP